ncbi:MAG: tryptophan--tRNA ligase [Defluviitaleaceae bacterium]|nr:tryptophan--tRNA ligase [Defluviitaleaceae bacterium]
MQATGVPSLGNYVGAVKNWVELQKDYSCLFCVVDMHSITIRHDPAEFRKKCRELLTLYIAMGLNPQEHIVYFQSHVPAHAELAWILNCFTYMGELSRMTQFKDKSKKNEDNINAGLFTYPVLQAADILLFNTKLVPIGDDQKQHLELCRDIAVRFNKIYGDIFVVPDAYIPPVGAKIKSLQEPTKKMSKSETANLNNVIHLLDPPDVIIKKFKRAVTDSLNKIEYNPEEQPGVSNLLTIYACATNQTMQQCLAEFANTTSYGNFKLKVGGAVVAMLEPLQKRYHELIADTAYIDEIIANNAERANQLAQTTLTKVKNAIGFMPKSQ